MDFGYGGNCFFSLFCVRDKLGVVGFVYNLFFFLIGMYLVFVFVCRILEVKSFGLLKSL